MLTLAELKRIIKKYDETMGIDPKGKTKEQLRKEIEKVGYKIDDDNKKLVATFKQKTKKMPKKVDLPKSEKKKPVDKAEAKKKKHEDVENAWKAQEIADQKKETTTES